MSGAASPPPPRRKRDSPLGWLGREVVRHPWYPVFLWTAIVLVCLYPAVNVGSVISNSFDNPLPSNDESVRADALYAAQFPNAKSAPSSAVILLEGTNLAGPAGKNATLAIAQTIGQDHTLRNVSAVVTLYAAYEGYLIGQAQLGWLFLGPAVSGSPSLPEQVNGTATEVWGPVATYLLHWQSIAANLSSGTPKSQADWPAYNQTRSQYAPGSVGAAVLTAFYDGSNSSGPGFNQSIVSGCLATGTVDACATTAARAGVAPVLSTIFPSSPNRTVAGAALSILAVQNWSDPTAQQSVGAAVLGASVGLAPAWLLTLWQAFPGGPPTSAQLGAWASGVVASRSIAQYPLPIPPKLYTSFVNPSATATLIVVSFSASDSYTVNGTAVNYASVTQIQHDVDATLASSSQYSGIRAYLTGAAPLDSATSYLATSALSLLLLLTVVVLLVIMILYFRAPAAPALSFSLIGVAAVLSLAVMFVLGKFVTQFNPEVQPVVLVFLMSIGTDYSVFLLARYREELVRKATPAEAVQETVRWAGQSIATSGLAVMVVTVALSLSGISFLAQMGDVLFFTVMMALLVNLTLLPSILVLVGPRIFWPNSGRRFDRYAERRRARKGGERDYIHRAGLTATRRPVAVIATIAIISAPVIYVALNVPVSYDITNLGLPASEPAQIGFTQLTNDFGESYSSPSYALVSFHDPVFRQGSVDPTEIADISALTSVIAATPGVASVDSLAGGSGTPASVWLNLSSLPPAQKILLNQSIGSYVGSDGRTVVFNIATNSSGFSASAISVLDATKQRVDAFVSGRAEVTQVLFGGAAPVTKDIKALVDQANQRMLIGAAIGLFLMMILILGSAFVPLIALGAIGLAIMWGWASTYFVVGIVEKEALIFLLPLILLILVLGLGMDYSVLLLTRVREERSKGLGSVEAIRQAVTNAGGVITAAAVILGGAFLLLGLTSPLGLLAGIGLGIGLSVLIQAFVVQTYLTPAILTLGKDAIWKGWPRSK